MKNKNIRDIIYECLYLTMNRQVYNKNQKNIDQLIILSNGNKYIERINEIKQNCIIIINHYAKLCIIAQGNNK